MPIEKTKARFFEPMLLLATSSLPEGQDWDYELKLDGYRAIAFKSNGRVHLRYRRRAVSSFRHIDEQVFRFNTRKITDAERFASVMKQIVGRRLTYKELTGKTEDAYG